AGGMAGTGVDVALYPLDTIKTRLQSSQGFLKAGGFKGVYKGLSAAAAGSAPGGEIVSPVQGAVCGSISGGFAAFVTTPLDVIKTRLMLGKDAQGVEYRGMRDAFTRVYTQEGWQTLFSGVKPRTTWITIGGFVFFGVYEQASATLPF
ncbi:hypothetical protein DYB32_001583, partial [Aphanomyces invadans]